MAVVLQFEKAETGSALKGVSWNAELIFPGPVSWVELRLNIDDPNDRVAEIGLQLKMNLDQSDGSTRTLVELGASRTIYRSLNGDELLELRADHRQERPWQVLRGVEGRLQPFCFSRRNSPPADGWAHIMDRRRCLAIAFDQFGRQGEERIKVEADGTLTASKHFFGSASTNGGSSKQWRAWLHFVHFPPQQSATTDPFMMQNPLIARQVQP